MGDDFPFRGKWPDFLNYNYGGLDLLQVEMRMAGVQCVCESCWNDIFSRDDQRELRGQRNGVIVHVLGNWRTFNIMVYSMGYTTCSDFARSQELALSFFSENELIKFFKVAPIPFPGVWESAE